ncbi:glycerophosphodiester phosphodiesterase [Ornithinibacillus sp. L9]|uniref:Glycerophosphodiester phosphodiesterase n=1 Tax=Ornithinibacillus caprae TaxID=2678566 RepID=A0A6N8FH44_9BACI|nr:glycerophosphodiester phosphodiesterase [Ornithinibacillus caprae]MUK87387.1 glycerophosphodiester phosphodiesterase [Ornithinibacillus caprae]
MTKIIAHRGSAGTHPENTMAAFREAERVGADGIELDVHLTKDGKLAVIHDETVDRTTNGSGHVKDFSLTELQRLDAGSSFSKQFTGERIPELADVLSWVKEKNLLVNIELKNVFYLEYPGLEEKVLAEVERFNVKGQTIISSFNHVGLNKVRELDQDIDIAILYSAKLYQPWQYAGSLGATSIHPHFYSITEDMIRTSERKGIPTRPYTINEVPLMEKLIKAGCTAIITDFPARAIEVRKRLNRS